MRERRKFGHRWHTRIDPKDLRPGDTIAYFDNGLRWRHVEKVTRRGRIRTRIKRYNGHVIHRSKSLMRSEIAQAWTKRRDA